MHDVACVTQDLDLGNDTTVYDVMAVPPLLAGAIQCTVMTPFLSRAVTWRGGDETVVGATADELTTKTCVLLLASVYVPCTPQLPSALHDTSDTTAVPPLLSEDVPGTSIGVDHELPFSLTKNTWALLLAS